jgi:catechol 2,3-dioxygenase-like lactoylglutathione lyase family enzyme
MEATMSEINITGINHVALWVRDLKRSAAWYQEVLGMAEAHGDDRHVFLKAGDQVLALFQAPEGQEIGGPHHVALSLPPGEKPRAEAALRARGIEVTSERGHFHDPDGHRLHFDS